ncbi:glucose-1-phosphate thymidylyltransferase [Deinococcus soli (ex Cha et al. 2016)]|uniref:Glucose-1-phosphate thymidylyltransferase n=2 Tax=Deinococcus soli (ex Cha et al. 2016) TaxID=1309411 RepID=A0ACC6KJA5_9DEIO|nr:glucose-1-phosphate thymidylyltransferase [Deinococcus soli (ex Cha et al. 2016)]MDR6219605.1 glucose-1-phosphate thymidylyltransferase [Deinococcus soli (ex Cha et al. 2016)]MDR6329794.1 glucose-1-phosphate thymidylyltransferase [Deinococcus soli (ex Cha et al. 2016)]MDR6752513.1 glucose-1-phosphate thymidylyltransferase [Deinococcus soli (ex Cha et al. 2016)]
MKAIIPAAGLGTRLRPLTYTRPKPVLRVAGQPIIAHAIHTLVHAGITDIGIVVSDITRAEIQHAVEHLSGVRITLIDQHEQLGLGHAVLTARDWVAQDDFCVYLGDNLFEHGATPFVHAFQQHRPSALIALVEVPDPTAFGVAQLDGTRITRLVEKPKDPPSNLAVAGLYCFTPEIFDMLDGMPPSARGEFEITDGIQRLIDAALNVQGQAVQGWWKDTGRPADLLDANRLLLERLQDDVQGEVTDSRITGRVVIPASARVIRSKIVGPVMLGEGVVIEDAYIGPFTSIGANSVIRGAEVEHSVVDEGAQIENVSKRLQDCLIGVRAQVRGGRTVPRTHKLTISDASLVELA